MNKHLSFEKVPHFLFSSNKQFEAGEKHITRIYDISALILMRRGVLNFFEDGKYIELQPGEYYIQKPNLLQQGIKPSNKPNYYFIHFRGHYSKGGSLPLRGRFDINKIQPLIEKLDKLGDSSELLEKEKVFYEILIALKESRNLTSIPEKIRSFITDNYNKKITLHDISRHVLLSKNQTINIFREKYDITPHQFLIKMRLRKASELIISTNDSFQEICYAVGFTDYSNFYKEFKKEFNESPKDYRNKISSKQLPK